MRAREGLRRPTRPDLEVALKAAVGAGLAMWLSELAGLADSYWAAISAVVAGAPTLGANLTAALSRVAATVVGLALGLAAVAVWGSGVLVAGVTVFIALLVLPALSLDRGARLGAATTVIMTALPSAEALHDALARGLNVLLGCGVAVAVGFVVFPTRAGERLRDALRADVAATGELASSALETYLGPAGRPHNRRPPPAGRTRGPCGGTARRPSRTWGARRTWARAQAGVLCRRRVRRRGRNARHGGPGRPQ
jgi:uncharacterized membrane protein YccC